jgi:hypothetical protein
MARKPGMNLPSHPNKSSMNCPKLTRRNPMHGPDDIPNWLLKTCAPILSDPISSIFNALIAQGSLPNVWNSVDVLAIPKVSHPKSVDDDLDLYHLLLS